MPRPTGPPAAQPLLDNPGNLPVVIADSDPANITFRQLVRVAVAGKRIRLRFSNEGGSDALVLGAVHVGAAGPDGRVLPGSDHAVTFDGHSGVVVPAGAPLLSDPVDLKVDALEKLVISVHVPGTLSRTGHSLFNMSRACRATRPQRRNCRPNASCACPLWSRRWKWTRSAPMPWW